MMTRRFSLVLLILAPALMAAVALLGRTDSATGAGTLDQTLIGNPACSYDTFQGGVGVGGGALDQEFIPSMSVLNAAEVCILLHEPETEPGLDVNIRRGTAAHPGTVIASKSLDGPVTLQWFRVDFDPVAVAPGERLVLEVSGRFGWQSTCPVIAGSCDHVDPDLYPAGESYFENRDFGFRTYGSDGAPPTPGPPPLTIQWGNLNCDLSADPADTLIPLAIAAGVTLPQPAAGGDCPPIGTVVTVFGRAREWGDVDCLDNGAPRDALDILLNLSGNFPYPKDIACPLARQFVNVNY